MKVASTLCVCLMILTQSAFAGKFNKQLDVGDRAPKFSQLRGIDDKLHGLNEFKSAKVVVVCFTCNHCPVAQAYEERFAKFARDFAKRDVQFVAINVFDMPADRLDKMKERAKKRGFTFPYLHDPSQQAGIDFGASATPNLFVLDKDRRVAYMGAFDDRFEDPTKVEEEYVRDAVEALLKGQRPDIQETRPRGCPIAYEKR